MDAARLAHERAVDAAAGLVRPLWELLDDVQMFVRRYVVVTDAQAVALTLWVAHTWALDAATTTAYLHITSPTKRGGKSLLLEVVGLLVRRPLIAANVTEAALYRSISVDPPPTVLLDEVDAIFGPKAHNHEDLRALLNAGFRRGTPVLRCVGEGSRMQVVEFDTFSAKALAGIGGLPDTLADRSLPIRLKRRTRAEAIERFRIKRVTTEAAALRGQLEGWARDSIDELDDAEPDLPDELDDRAQDALEPLIAIADLASSDWAQRARRAFVELRGESDVEDDILGIHLLADVRTAFGEADRISTVALLEKLKWDDEAPWATYRNTGLSARGLGTLLRPFGVRSRTVRFDGEDTAKGYLREQFDDAFARYLPQSDSVSVTSVTTAPLSQNQGVFNPSQDPSVTDAESPANPHEQTVVTVVTDRTPETVETLSANGRRVAAEEALECIVCGAGYRPDDECPELLRCPTCVGGMAA